LIRRQNPPNRDFPEFGGFGRFRGKSPNLAPGGRIWGFGGPRPGDPRFGGPGRGAPGGPPGGGPGRGPPGGPREGAPGGPPGGGPRGGGPGRGPPGAPWDPRKPRIWGFPGVENPEFWVSPPIYISGYIYRGAGEGQIRGFPCPDKENTGLDPSPHLSKITPTSPDR